MDNAMHCPDSRPYSSSWYSIGTSLQLRLMWGVFSNNANDIYFFLMIFPIWASIVSYSSSSLIVTENTSMVYYPLVIEMSCLVCLIESYSLDIEFFWWRMWSIHLLIRRHLLLPDVFMPALKEKYIITVYTFMYM